MANAPQMKIPIGADTRDFEKGSRQVKQEMKDLNKVSSDAFSAIGNALGVDTGKLQQFSSALAGATRSLGTMGNDGKSAFAKIVTAAAPATAAIAGLGIGAAIIGFKALTSEAENFKSTVAGANIELQTAAYVNTYIQVMHDFSSATGKQVAEVEAKWKKFWGTLGANVKMYFGTGAWKEDLTPWSNNTSATTEYLSLQHKAADAAKKAEEITGEIFKLERKRKEQAVELAKLSDQIADAIGIAKDNSNSLAVRQAAIAKAEDLIAQKKNMVVPLEQKLATLYRQRSNLASDDVAAADATLAQEQQAYDVSRAITQEANSLLRIKNSIVKASQKSAAEAAKEAEMMARVAEARANGGIGGVAGLNLSSALVRVPVQPLVTSEAVHEFKEHFVAELGGGFTIAFALDPDSVEKIHDLSREVEGIATNMATSIGEAIGNLAADLINGEDAWGNFANAALSAFGDMAISIGKIAIEAGLASEGIKAALSLGGGWVAIAAGVALVALGTAIKSGLANVASGNYSAGASAVSAGATSPSGKEYEQREVTVNVTGELVADGDELRAVLNNTGRRDYYIGG